MKDTKVTKASKKGEKADERWWLTEGKDAAAGGSTEARRKDQNGCTEVRNREEVPPFI